MQGLEVGMGTGEDYDREGMQEFGLLLGACNWGAVSGLRLYGVGVQGETESWEEGRAGVPEAGSGQEVLT